MSASAERFHGDGEWDTLPEEVRRELGGALLQHAVARRGADTASSEREERPFLAAAEIIAGRVEELLDEEFWGALIPDDQVPPVPAMLGRYCLGCGCSDHDACGGFADESCGWAADGLCTRCARARLAPWVVAALQYADDTGRIAFRSTWWAHYAGRRTIATAVGGVT